MDACPSPRRTPRERTLRLIFSPKRAVGRVGAIFVPLALLVAPAQAQYADAGNRKEQIVAQQLQAASVGGLVEVMFQRNRDVRPTGVVVS
jgi:hypothetical protein